MCKCRKPTQSVHAFEGFAVFLNRGFGTYYVMRDGEFKFFKVPRTIKSWQGAAQWFTSSLGPA